MLSCMDLCVTDSSGESDSSDDSDIEGETASALFMVSGRINGCLCILLAIPAKTTCRFSVFTFVCVLSQDN